MSFCASNPGLWIWFIAASFVALGLILLSSLKEKPTVREVLLLAVLFRLILLPLMPSLSDDGYRYIWDGMLQAEGINPYLLVPSDPDLRQFHSLEIYSRLNSADYFTVYPPFSQLIFLASSWIPAYDWSLAFIFIKSLTVAVEIGGLFLLSSLVEPRKLILYAWNPLVVVEIAGQGHGEGIVAALLVTTIWAVKEKRPQVAAAAVTGAIWIKLYPVLLLPFVLRRIGWKYLWIPAVVSAVVAAPYMGPNVVAHAASSLDLYVRLFEFNAGPYYLLKSLGYATVGGPGLEQVLGPMLAVIYLMWVIWLYVRDRRGESELTSVMSMVLGGFVVFATTVHPWYLVPILAFVPFMRYGGAAWLWLAATSTATYLFYSDGIYWPFVWLGWVGVAGIGAWYWLPRSRLLHRFVDKRLRERAIEKADRVRPFLPELVTECELLDLGAGEGYVGERLEKTVGFRDTQTGFEIPGCKVTLCDVRDANRTELPYIVYNGHRLPFADHQFDATVLVFVLHHSESPSRLINEARRVTSRRVIIVESVHEGMLSRVFLRFSDRIVNRIRSHGEMVEQERWLRFRTLDEWITLIERDGGVVQSVRRWGRFHKQALFVIDSEVSGPKREFAVVSVGKGL
ncbi:MAG TPA: methyltransferase domain-containing protein [Rhodothermia bacterium]|nr:methyltransferase domain-containing protein [Rhodothermia bacterium]